MNKFGKVKSIYSTQLSKLAMARNCIHCNWNKLNVNIPDHNGGHKSTSAILFI